MPTSVACVAILVLAAVVASGCGESSETASSPNSPAVAASPSPTETEISRLFFKSRWTEGTDNLKQTRAVARDYLAAVWARDVSLRVSELYADTCTLDAPLDGTRSDDALTTKYTWGIWESNLYWSRDAATYVAPGAAVIVGAVMDDPDDPTMVIPYLDMLAVSDGKITHEEIVGDPHETGVLTKGWKPTAAAPGPGDTAKEARAVAAKVREVISHTGDFASLKKVYDPDIVLLDTSEQKPLRGVKAVLAGHEDTAGVAEVDSFAVEPPIAGPGWALLRFRANGTVDLEALSLPGAIFMDIRDGKVVRMATYYDSTVVDLSP